MRGIFDRLDRLVAATTHQTGGMYGSGLRIVIISLYSIPQCLARRFRYLAKESRTEVALDSCAILNRLSVNDKGVKKVAEGLRISFDVWEVM
jgi:hypothetical protein